MFIINRLSKLNKKSFIFKNLSTKPTQEQAQELVNVERLTNDDKGIVVIGLNRPGSKNAINKYMIDQLLNTFRKLYNDNDTRVVIFRSLVNGIFCAGADLKERLKLPSSDVGKRVTEIRNLANIIENVPVPVIAAVDGAALGGGFELALSCDFIVCASNSIFGLVETRLGIIPGAGGTQRLARAVGGPIAKELIYTARLFNAQQALQYGAVNKVSEQNDEGISAYKCALQIAREILPNGPLAVKMAKKAISHGQQVDINNGCAIEEFCYSQVIPTKDRMEGLLAFVEKRKPNYTGS
ncbi:methylglutaconyl-CoA hydratase, mitochondrial [Melanaphis sacchari]|uniref:Enoyl-CoA hydratase domain-containing protein 2, mitochondrial n=1 Tax=Melanaphis sacchari TaxID=742174 RepID=A0A2H8TED4_9HEMI|nr:methylglutaconyl-CoA hydratase, mitochondrial [Melanaphis sacchari]